MIILTIRTDKPEAEIGLYNNDVQLAYEKWEGHKQLSVTILKKIEDLLNSQNRKWQDIQGIVGYKGPGSFTGLRIGLTVANTLADNLPVSIVGSSGEDWAKVGIEQLISGKDEKIILPNYGSKPHTTKQKK